MQIRLFCTLRTIKTIVYTIYFYDSSGDINTTLGQRAQRRERAYNLMQIPVIDLKNTNHLETNVMGSNISFDLPTKDPITYSQMDPEGIPTRIFLGIFVLVAIIIGISKIKKKL